MFNPTRPGDGLYSLACLSRGAGSVPHQVGPGPGGHPRQLVPRAHPGHDQVQDVRFVAGGSGEKHCDGKRRPLAAVLAISFYYSSMSTSGSGSGRGRGLHREEAFSVKVIDTGARTVVMLCSLIFPLLTFIALSPPPLGGRTPPKLFEHLATPQGSGKEVWAPVPGCAGDPHHEAER